jgi:TM2 domain-containing membrane protein YozV
MMKTTKARALYVAMGLTLGYTGIHDFYAGYYLRGALFLVIYSYLSVYSYIRSWITVTPSFFIDLLHIAVWLVVIVEVCITTHDADGVKMGELFTKPGRMPE